MKKIAIIGTGISGLALNRFLQEKCDISLFEKARGVGGRMSCRTYENFQFDHGCSQFTANTSIFRDFLTPFLTEGIIKKMSPSSSEKFCKGYHCQTETYLPLPKANSLCKQLARQIKPSLETEIVSLQMKEGKWELRSKKGEIFSGFDFVISTAPAPQTVKLFPKEFEHYNSLTQIEMTSAFTLMVGLSENRSFDLKTLSLENSPFRTLSIDSYKPFRNSSPSFVAITTEKWSENHLNEDLELIKSSLTKEFVQLLQLNASEINYQAIHRWLYCIPKTSLEKEYLLDEKNKLAACGDFCLGNGVEAAFLSASALAKKLEQI